MFPAVCTAAAALPVAAAAVSAAAAPAAAAGTDTLDLYDALLCVPLRQALSSLHKVPAEASVGGGGMNSFRWCVRCHMG